MERLEDDADMGRAEARQRVLIHRREVLAGDADGARGRPFEAGDYREHRRLARTRRADDADRLAARDGEVEAAQDVDVAGRGRQAQRNSVEQHHGRGFELDVDTSRLTRRAVIVAALATTAAPWLPARAAGATRIVALGDSLTAGYGLKTRDAFPARLQAALAAMASPPR